MKKILSVSMVITCLFSCVILPAQKNKLSSSFITEQLDFATAQYTILGKNTPENEFPRSYDSASDRLITSNSSWWCSGFYPGALLHLYEFTGNNELKERAIEKMQLLKHEQYNTGTHDLGFMMYCTFGNSWRLWHNEEDKTILLNSARSLSSRFNAKAGVIRSWDHGDWKFPVIIDNMMNLELLTWATKASGDSSFYNIAITHAHTTLQHHFRKDYSSYHVIDYDTTTGKVLKKQTEQGANDSSAWARGQAWALYGYTAMYRETQNKSYLEHARHTAEYLLKHPNRTRDDIPYWDYNAPNIPHAFRDASAAAVISSALLELSQFVRGKEKQQYINTAENILRALGSPAYRAPLGKNGGFILMHSVGHLPANSEIDVPLTYADYYFIEALIRYKKWILNETSYIDTSHYSEVFSQERFYRLYLPDNYSSGKEKYPVIYFFHGWGGRYYKDDNALLNYGKIKSLSNKYQTIIVMWDGNIDTAEPRPYNTGNHEDVKYNIQMKDYFQELVTHIDSSFRTLKDKQHRGIIGFSMGGFMSFYLAGKYPDKINAAVSLAGSPEFFIGYPHDHTLYPVRYTFSNLNEVRTRLHNGNTDILYHLNEEVRSGAEWEDHPLDYYRFNGGHMIDSAGETKVFESAVKFVSDAFKKEIINADRWSHYDLYPEFSAYNYTIHSNKRTPGFMYLKNVDKFGFGLYSHAWLPDGPPTNTDTVNIITAPIYEPEKQYHVIQYQTASGKLDSFEKKADNQGRLAFLFNTTGIETGISAAGKNTSFVITGHTVNKTSKYLHNTGTAEIFIKILNRGKNIDTNKRINITLSANDSSITIRNPVVSLNILPDERLAEAGPFRIRINKNPPLHAEPSQVKFKLLIEDGYYTSSDDIVVPVLYESPLFDSIVIDDHLSNNNHVAEAGEQLMIYSGTHRLRLYTEDKFIIEDREILADEMIPARWPDGFTLSSVVTVSPDCPAGHIIEFYGSFETKTFEPIERKTTWGKLKIQVN